MNAKQITINKFLERALQEIDALRANEYSDEMIADLYRREHDKICGMVRRANETMKGVTGAPRKQYFKEIEMRKAQERRKSIEFVLSQLKQGWAIILQSKI